MSISPGSGTVSGHGAGSLISLELQQSYSTYSWDRDTSSSRARGEQQSPEHVGHSPLFREYCKNESDKAKKYQEENVLVN